MGSSEIWSELLAFDDVAVVPGKAFIEPSQVDLKSRFSKSVELSIPIASSPMDTVTEWRLATALARVGALGVIHRNLSVEEQVSQVLRVKSEDPGIDREVLIATGGDVRELVARASREGVASALIMSGKEPLAVLALDVGNVEYWLDKALGLAKLVKLVDIEPALDEKGRLRVAAAISPFDYERITRLDSVEVDALVVDVAHAHNENVISSLANISRELRADLVVGNVGSKEAVVEYVSRLEKIDGFRVGIGSGSICSTAETTGAYMPTLTAVLEARRGLEEVGLWEKVPIIADGGIRGASDAVKAFIAGASSIMSGRLFAGVEESAGLKLRIGDRVYKQYRGMASKGAMEKRFASDRYSRPSKSILEGVEGLVPYAGSVYSIIAELVAGIKAGLGYAGARNVRESWNCRLARLTSASKTEAGPHDVIVR
ncbi:MAG: IMP dehydrogenase [Acidilobaceae archaeon]